MLATDRMINYIRRDELTHVTIFANIIHEIKKEFPNLKIVTGGSGAYDTCRVERNKKVFIVRIESIDEKVKKEKEKKAMDEANSKSKSKSR